MIPRELEEEETTARRRAVRVIDGMTESLARLRRRLDGSSSIDIDGLDARNLASSSAELTYYLAVLEAFRSVREWDGDVEEEDSFRCHGCGKILHKRREVDDHMNRHGLVTNLTEKARSQHEASSPGTP